MGRWVRGLAALAMVCLGLAGGAAQAQETTFVQIEAQPTLAEALARARAYAGLFDDVKGFRLSSGWYAIALGPASRAEAARRLAALRAERMIPADSFLAEARSYREPYWPVAGGPPDAPLPAAPPPAASPPAAPPPAAPPPAAPPPAVPTDETLAEARAGEAALSRAEREALQVALQWKGFYGAAIDGAFGPATRAAMAAWQASVGLEPTGVLTTRQRAQLLEGYSEAIARLGFETLRDEASGISVQLPLAMVAFDRYDPPFVRFAPRGDSGLEIWLISQPGDAASLAGLYEAIQRLDVVPPAGPRQLAGTRFTISAQGAGLASFAFAETRDGLIKGYLAVWTPAASAVIDRVIDALRASFAPYGRHALSDDHGQLDAAARAALIAGVEERRPLRARSGVFVDARGTVLTAAEAVADCGRVTLDAAVEAETVLLDAALGVALLHPRRALAPRGVAELRLGAPQVDAAVAVAGFSWGEVMSRPVLTFGRIAALEGLDGAEGRARLALDPLPGDIGGPVLDETGAVLGILLPPGADAARLLPPGVAEAAQAGALAQVLAAAGIAPHARAPSLPLAPEDVAGIADAMTVLVSCWR